MKKTALVLLVSLSLCSCNFTGSKDNVSITPLPSVKPAETSITSAQPVQIATAKSAATPTPEPSVTATKAATPVPAQIINSAMTPKPEFGYINEDGTKISDRFNVPEGFKRTTAKEGSFEAYLQNLDLKPNGAKVLYHDGREKSDYAYLAVINYDLGERDLQQCADSIMRLRAEYFYGLGKYGSIHFNFVDGFKADFLNWSKGNKIVVGSGKTHWASAGSNNSSAASFKKYLNMVYAYAGTLSLEKEMIPKSTAKMGIGDVFIKGGSPGHCVIVVDMAENEAGEKVFMLAQGYMPAQDIQILKNPNEEFQTPWYSIDFGETLKTPEWSFPKESLRSWE